MTILTISALHDACSKPQNRGKEQKTTTKIGQALAAILLVGGLLAVYGLSASGVAGKGPFTGIGMKGNIAILGTFGALELLTLTGLALKRCGFGSNKPDYLKNGNI